jgi:hypothetical protein
VSYRCGACGHTSLKMKSGNYSQLVLVHNLECGCDPTELQQV